jgi:hypothetical protein
LVPLLLHLEENYKAPSTHQGTRTKEFQQLCCMCKKKSRCAWKVYLRISDMAEIEELKKENEELKEQLAQFRAHTLVQHFITMI